MRNFRRLEKLLSAIAGDRYPKSMALSKDRRHPLQDVLVRSRALYCQLFKLRLWSTPICFSMKCVHNIITISLRCLSGEGRWVHVDKCECRTYGRRVLSVTNT